MKKHISYFSIWWRQLIHKPLTTLFKVTLKQKIRLLRSDFIPDGKPTIYAATHVFYDDIATVCCCLKQSAHLLLGVEGPNNTPAISEKIALSLNGLVVVNRECKLSRAESFKTMVDILNKQGNLLIFPESAWNFSPNLLIQKLNWGIIKIAEQTAANIVPVAVAVVDNDLCVMIGDTFDYMKHANHQDAAFGLRDAMATLVWELLSMEQPIHRSSLTDSYWLQHIQKQYLRMPRKDQSTEESFIYHPKDEIDLGKLLANLHGIEHRSMAVDYDRHKEIMQLCDSWNKSIKIAP